MRTEIRQSTTSPDSPSLWIWRTWDQGRLIARGQSPTKEEALEAARLHGGTDPRAGANRPPSYR